MNTGLKLINFKKTTKEFLKAMEDGVNAFRHPDRKIVLMHDQGLIKLNKSIDVFSTL
jgi:hypothetical protein